jgi:hypothetical protein
MNTSIVAATAALAAANLLANGGTLSVYSGAMPATPETAATGTKLATWTFSGTAFGTITGPSGGNVESTASFVSGTVTPSANGTAGYARSVKSDGTTVIGDYSVGTSGADLNLTTTTFSTSVPATISSFKHKMPAV